MPLFKRFSKFPSAALSAAAKLVRSELLATNSVIVGKSGNG